VYERAMKEKLSSLGLVAWLLKMLGSEQLALEIVAQLEEGVTCGPRAPRKPGGKQDRFTPKAKPSVAKCTCGRPVWVGSHTNQCFPCTPAQVSAQLRA
jgi:hypothetical protein